MPNLTNLRSPAAVLAAIDECKARGRKDFLSHYGFGRALEYTLKYQGGEYDSKAIAAVAYGYQEGTHPLRSGQFSGGKSRGAAGWALNRLGFSVDGIIDDSWRFEELLIVTNSYFDMLSARLADEKLQVGKRVVAIQNALEDAGYKRTIKAIEYKLQNVSGVLVDLGREWMQGFAPAKKYQAALRYLVEERLGVGTKETSSIEPHMTDQGHALSKTDWAKRDERNRELGLAGENFVLEYERTRLRSAGRPDLAAQVRHLSLESDEYGYDVLSFTDSGAPVFAEVKTTTGPRDIPFFLSENELRVAHENPENFRIFRVSRFPKDPTLDVFATPLQDLFDLTPSVYRAAPKLAK